MPAPLLPPIDKLDPGLAWQPWQPDENQRWDLKWAGHLYRRAAFGASPKQLREAVKEGLPATLDRLFQGDADQAARDESLRRSTGQAIVRANEQPKFRAWWLYWMMYGGNPLREKMTLFWHNHFATSIVKVTQAELMLRQNELLYRHALGHFRPLLVEISKDPAMLIWLDSNSNVKGKANENYAREVMELFSLGVGNYTEKDIREAARAFTGWHTDGETFTFNADEHDPGRKTVLNQSGDWDGGDIVRILLEQPAAPQFLVRKLYRFFISETVDPPTVLLQPLADDLQKSDYDIGALVQRILRSRLFFSEHAYRQRIKSPVEFVIGAANEVGRNADNDELLVQPSALVETLGTLGQSLFAPPNVKGWRYGQSWLSTATVLARANYAEALTAGQGQLKLPDRTGRFDFVEPGASLTLHTDPAAYVHAAKLTDPVKIVELIADVLLQGDLSEAARTKLINYLAEAKGGNDKPAATPPPPPPPKVPRGQKPIDRPVPVAAPAGTLDQAVRDVFHAVMTMPEYQLA